MITILIAHYKETWEQMFKLLNSIAIQDVDLSMLDVVIMNDGDEVIFDRGLFNQFPFSVKYIIHPRAGTSKIRNALLQEADSKYIWYLDPDDYLIPNSLSKVITELRRNVDLLVIGSQRQVTKESVRFFCPSYTSFSIVGCNILKRQFLIDNNLLCDESVFLAGDLVLEMLPKWYARSRKRLQEPVLFYTYEPSSVTHCKNNGWRDEADKVVGNNIERLLRDNKNLAAAQEFKLYLFTYNSKYIYDRLYSVLENKDLININYELDLR